MKFDFEIQCATLRNTFVLDFILPPGDSPTMENPIDRTIRLMALAAGLVSLAVFFVFQFV